jgi:molecular chaperone GrpE
MTDPYTQNAPQGHEAYARSAGDAPADDEPQPEDAAMAVDPEAPAEAADAEAVVADDVTAQLAEVEKARDEYLDHLRRERAEFENFRKRSHKERMDALDRGAEQLLANLLPILDNFGFALDAAKASDDEQLAKGVEMVHGQLLDALRQAGLQEVPGIGETFDPIHHEAMLSEDADEPLEEPVVVEVLRTGYRFKGRVLRPASVKVAR